MRHKNLIIDTNNLAFVIRHSTIKTPPNLLKKETHLAEFIFSKMLSYVLSFAKNNNLDSIVVCLEGQDVWRKSIYPDYKANREYHDDEVFPEILRAIELFQSYFREYTSAMVLHHQNLEADDLIAIWCQESENVENYILSSDKDFIQLTDERTKVYSPHQQDWLTSEDTMFDLFVKCIRGDRGDNIRSAYPRVRLTKLQEAWDDSYKMVNILETVLPDGKKVNDHLEFNMMLIDLKRQPEQYRIDVQSMIESYEFGSYSVFKTLKYMRTLGFKDFEQELKFRDKPLKLPPVFNGNK
jgi:hypothetical protein